MGSRDCFRLAYTAPRMSADGEAAEIFLYGEIIQDIPEEWKWSREDKSARDFDKAIKDVREQGAKKVNVRINSPGGIVTEAMAMRGILASAGFEEINIRIEGLCASAATLIASLPGAHVAIMPGSEYMIHNPWTVGYGNAEDMERIAEHLRSEEATARGMYQKRTGKDEETIKGWMDRETWFTAEEAVKEGFCDEVTSEDAQARAAACVSAQAMSAMRKMYRHVPENLTAEPIISNAPADVVTAETAEHTQNEAMQKEEHTNMTIEELRNQEPALVESIMQAGADNERQRIQDIEDLTPIGYEEMAAQAKQSGMSAMDYHKAVIKAQKEKGQKYLSDRKGEVAPSRDIAGEASEEHSKQPAEEMDSFAKEMAGYAKNAARVMDGGMY